MSMSDKRDWLLLSIKHSRGEAIRWYRTGSAGYTMSLLYAGRYTRTEALGEWKRCPEHCLAVQIESVADFSGTHPMMFNETRTIDRLKELAESAAKEQPV